MITPVSSLTRAVSALLVVVSVTAFGCARYSHFQMASYRTFDAWLVGGQHREDPSDLGVCECVEGNFAGYVLNDVFIRMPVYAAHDASKFLLIPVAAPYFGVRSMSGGADAQATPEETEE